MRAAALLLLGVTYAHAVTTLGDWYKCPCNIPVGDGTTLPPCSPLPRPLVLYSRICCLVETLLQGSRALRVRAATACRWRQRAYSARTCEA